MKYQEKKQDLKAQPMAKCIINFLEECKNTPIFPCVCCHRMMFRKGVKVFVAGIKQRDGIKFISYTLLGAKNADILNLQGSVEIGVADDAIFIQSI